MDRESPSSLPIPSAMRLFASCAVLAIVVALVAIGVGAAVVGGLTATALWFAGVAGCVCWLAGSFALTATYLGNRWQSPIQGVLGGMFFRLGLPLAAVVGLPRWGGVFALPGLTTALLGVYLVTLLVETLLALRLVQSQRLPRHTRSAAAS